MLEYLADEKMRKPAGFGGTKWNTYDSVKYQQDRDVFAQRFGYDCEAPPDARACIQSSADWSGTYLQQLPHCVMEIITEYWADCCFGATYLYAGIMYNHLCPRQSWCSLVPRLVNWAPSDAEPCELFMQDSDRLHVGDTYVSAVANNREFLFGKQGLLPSEVRAAGARRVEITWGSRVEILSGFIGQTAVYFLDRWGTLLVQNGGCGAALAATHIIHGGSAVEKISGTVLKELGCARLMRYYYIIDESGDCIRKYLRGVCIEVALWREVCDLHLLRVDSRGNFMHLGRNPRLLRPAWVPVGTVPTVTIGVVSCDLDDDCVWSITPDGFLYGSFVRFSRVYKPNRRCNNNV